LSSLGNFIRLGIAAKNDSESDKSLAAELPAGHRGVKPPRNITKTFDAAMLSGKPPPKIDPGLELKR
jgi:hypothetical protein